MGYLTSNPPAIYITGFGGHPTAWIYKSEDVHTDVDAPDYFSNGDDLGMKVDDIVFVIKTTATKGATMHTVASVTPGGAATITAAILA